MKWKYSTAFMSYWLNKRNPYWTGETETGQNRIPLYMKWKDNIRYKIQQYTTKHWYIFIACMSGVTYHLNSTKGKWRNIVQQCSPLASWPTCQTTGCSDLCSLFLPHWEIQRKTGWICIVPIGHITTQIHLFWFLSVSVVEMSYINLYIYRHLRKEGW